MLPSTKTRVIHTAVLTVVIASQEKMLRNTAKLVDYVKSNSARMKI